MLTCRWSFLCYRGLPEVARHVDVAVGLEMDALGLEQGTLAAPAGGGAACLVDDTMAGQQFGTRRVAEDATYHARVAGPACPGGNVTVGGDLPCGYLADDVQHVRVELVRLGGRHASKSRAR